MMTRFATNDSYILRLLSLSSSRLLGSILTQLHETVSKEATHVLNSDLTKRLCRLAVELWGFLLRHFRLCFFPFFRKTRGCAQNGTIVGCDGGCRNKRR